MNISLNNIKMRNKPQLLNDILYTKKQDEIRDIFEENKTNKKDNKNNDNKAFSTLPVLCLLEVHRFVYMNETSLAGSIRIRVLIMFFKN